MPHNLSHISMDFCIVRVLHVRANDHNEKEEDGEEEKKEDKQEDKQEDKKRKKIKQK